MQNADDMTGQKFARWTIVRRAENNARNKQRWLCRCECGIERVVEGQNLHSGRSRSCGCLSREVSRQACIARRTHGRSKSLTYSRWMRMRVRCEQPQSVSFPHYGARGIGVCPRWLDFENFLADMGECPTKEHTLDRIDTNGNYEPGNVRWATQKEQQNNRTNNHRITFRGETLTLTQWAERIGVKRVTLQARITQLGWPIERALTATNNP
jgi:hypothetical protein